MRTKNGHHGESNVAKPHQMGPQKDRGYKLCKALKKFYRRKNRMFLKNPKFFNIR